jgi:hypothetical protein
MTPAPKTPPSSQAGTAPEIGGIVVCAPVPGVQRIEHLARGKKFAPVRRHELPAPARFAGYGREADHRNCNHLRYPDRPLVPLAVVLPRMLEEIEIELAIAAPREKSRLHQRAELVRELLTSSRVSATMKGRRGA